MMATVYNSNVIEKKSLWFLFLALISFSSIHTSAQEPSQSSIPIDVLFSSGYSNGSHTVSETGGFTYSFPITTSPGIAGMKPQLTIGYNHQSGSNGHIGNFSASGFQSISRSGQPRFYEGITTAIELNQNDIFRYNGDILHLRNQQINFYGENGAYYHPEHNQYTLVQSFGNISGSPEYFIVKTKDGLTIEFGRTNDSRIEASGTNVPLEWLVNRIEDSKGNYMTYHYYENNSTGESYPIRIEYTGNESEQISPISEVLFQYEDREDVSTNYVHETVRTISKRLKKIELNADNQLFKIYKLNYEESGLSRKSLLSSIQECDADGNCFAPTNFEYSNDDSLSVQTYENSITNPNQLTNVTNFQTGDFNGDGLSDLIYQYHNGLDMVGVKVILGNRAFQTQSNGIASLLPYIFLNNNYSPSNTFRKASYDLIPLTSEFVGFKKISTGDFNGDGKTDIVLHAIEEVTNSNDYKLLCYISGCSDSELIFNNVIDENFYAWSDFLIGDFDGNGLEDIISYSFALGTFPSTGYYFSNNQNQIEIDEISNPLPNLAQYQQGIAINPIIAGPPNVWDKYVSINSDDEYLFGLTLDATDINADGITDILITSSTEGNEFAFLKGTNSGIFQELSLNVTNPSWYITESGTFGGILVDINNDGLLDLLRVTASWLPSATGTGYSFFEKITGYFLNKGNFKFNEFTPFLVLYENGTTFDHLNTIGINNSFFIDIDLDGNIDHINTFAAGSAHIKLGHGNGKFTNLDTTLFFSDGTAGAFSWTPGRYFTTPSVNFLGINMNGEGEHLFGEIYTEPKNLLSKITNGHVQKIEITYQPTSKDQVYTKDENFEVTYPQIKYQGPFYVVSHLRIKNSQTDSEAISFLYEDAVMEQNGIGFLGFRKMTTRNHTQNTRTVNTYDLDYKYGGNALAESESYLGNVLVNSTNSSYIVKELDDKIFNTHLSNTTRKTYDPNSGDLLDEQSTSFVYDNLGNALTSVTLRSDGTVDSLTNEYSNSIQEWHLGRLEHSYRTVSKPGITPVTKSSSFLYDEDGMLEIEITEPGNDSLELTISYLRDGFGNIIQTKTSGWNGTNNEDRIRTSQYDSSARFIEWTKKEGSHQTTYEHDKLTGKPLEITDANGLITKIIYDGFGREIERISPDGYWVKTGYYLVESNQQLEEVVHAIVITDSKGNLSIQYYDILDRLIRSETLNITQKLVINDQVYDNRGNVKMRSLPYFEGETPKWITSEYDAANRLVKEIFPDGTAKKISYNGLEATFTNQLNQKTTILKDIDGSIIKATDTDGNIVTKEYDLFGNLLKANSIEHTVIFEYDLRGFKIKTIDEAAGITTLGYNAFGELIKKSTPNGTTIIEYDKIGRIAKKQDGDEITIYHYDDIFIGSLNTIEKEGYYSVSFERNNLGKIVKETKSILDRTFITEWEYNTFGELFKTKYPSPNNTEVEYDYLQGQIIGVKSGTDYLWKFLDEDHFGNITAFEFGDNVSTTVRIFDENRGHLINTKASNQTGEIQNWSFSFDAIGNLTHQIDSIVGKEEFYDYDDLNQLIKYMIPSVDTVNIDYGTSGKIENKSDTGQYFWNDNGQLDSLVLNDGVSCYIDFSISYTPFGKISSIECDSVKLEIVYGDDYQRIAQKLHVNNELQKTRYYAGITELDVFADNTETAKDYITNGNEVFAVKIFNPVSPTSELLYLHKNHLGSTVAISDSQGNILERLNYDPWGKRRSSDWTSLNQPFSVLIDRGFTGHEHYDMFSLIDMNGRIYDPNLGIFLSPDPIYHDLNYNHLFNRYTYVGNNPLSLTDPTGLAWYNPADWDWGAIGVTAASIATGAVVTFFTGNPILGGMAAGAVGGFSGSLLNGASLGGALLAGYQGAIIGGVSAGFTAGIGHGGIIPEIGESLGANILEEGIRAGAHGVVQGGVEVASGGSFINGFASGAVSSSISSLSGTINFKNKHVKYSANLVISSVSGGTISELTGGSFANGATSGAFVYMYNHGLLQTLKGYSQRVLASKTKVFEYTIAKYEIAAGVIGSEQATKYMGKAGIYFTTGTLAYQWGSGDFLNAATGTITAIFTGVAVTSVGVTSAPLWVSGVVGVGTMTLTDLFFDVTVHSNLNNQ